MNGATALVDGGAEARHSGQVLLEVPIGLAMGGIGLAFSAESVGRTLSALQGHPPAPDRNHAQAKLVPGLGLAFAALLVLALISDGVTQRLQKSVLRVPGLVGLVISMMSTLGPTSRAVAAHDREDGDRATTLFVDAAAPAGGNGTQRRPCSTITCAVGQLDAAPAAGRTLRSWSERE